MENGFSIRSNVYEQENGALWQPRLSGQTKKKISEKSDNTADLKSIYAGSFYKERDQISDKFALAQKQAIHKLLSQFEEDYKIDAEMAGRSGRIEELKENIAQNNHNLLELDERREALKEYLTEEPTEQELKDLELVRKAKAYEKDPEHNAPLSQEERDAYENLPPLTDYQNAMLLSDEYRDEEREYRRLIQRDRSESVYQNAVNEATKQALLKVHPMADAKKEADAIMDNALQNMVSSLFAEGVDKIDKEKEERQEEIAKNREEALEEKLEREKRKAEDEEKRKELEAEVEAALLATTLEAVNYGGQTAMANLQSNVKSLIQDQIVLDVNLKGLKIDAEV